jgi:hypothetical protein
MTVRRFYFFSFIFLLIVVIPAYVCGQITDLKGTVIDGKTGSALAFVNILINESTYGGTTDIDGKFELKNKYSIYKLRFSYIGYETMELTNLIQTKRLVIKLLPKEILLNEVVIYPGENPAHRIILNLIKNRDLNDPKKLKSFSYTAYDKLVMTIDTNKVLFVDSSRVDTSSDPSRLQKFLAEKDFFIIETITERTFEEPDESHEKVLANKISGFKDPIFTFLLSQAQSTDFYNDRINLAGKSFISPLSSGSINKYLFILENQICTLENDTVFTISFRPLLNTNFDGLKGVLTIHSDNWAIKNVIAQPTREEKGLSIKIQQLYEKIDSIHWFPVQLNTDLILNSAQIVSGNKHFPMVGIGKSYLRDIEINFIPSKHKNKNIAIEVNPDASENEEEYWNQFRIDTLSLRDKGTYQFMDSVGKAENFDQKAKTFETLLTGKIPYKFIDFEIDKFIRINAYEGFYTGLGFHTNDRISKIFKFGGFWGYGFKDKAMKFGGDFSIMIHKNSQSTLRLAYKQDVIESGSSYFLGQNTYIWNDENFRLFFVSQMDFTKSYDFHFGFRAPKHFQWEIGLSQQEKKSFYDYYFQSTTDSTIRVNTYQFSEIRFAIRYAYGEKFLQTNRNLLSMGTDYPIIWFTYTHGMTNFSDIDQSYNKYELLIKKTFKTNYFGKLMVHIQSGFIDATIPATNLFYAPASFQNIGLYAPISFSTMRMNEFLSDKYFSMFMTHDFGKLIYRQGKFQPEIALALNIGYGSLKNKDSHKGLQFNTMESGFYECGILINNLIRLPAIKLGFGTFYRFGSYSYPEIEKNISYKFTMQVGF